MKFKLYSGSDRIEIDRREETRPNVLVGRFRPTDRPIFIQAHACVCVRIINENNMIKLLLDNM